MIVTKNDTFEIPRCILKEMLRIDEPGAKKYYVDGILMYLLNGETIEPLEFENGMNSLINISRTLIDNIPCEDE